MRSTILTLAGVLLLSAVSARAEIPWNENLRAAHQQAEREGKLLLLHFYTDNCHWCDKLEAGAFQSLPLSAAIGQHYVPVKIHAGNHPALAKTFKVSRFPTDVIVSADGSVLSHGVSPQAAEDYIGMLARYSGQAPAAAHPMAPGAATDPQIVQATPLGFPAPATVAAQTPGFAPSPQINQFAMQAPSQPQAASQPQANPYAPSIPGPSANGIAATTPAAAPTAQLALPSSRIADAPAAAPTDTGFSLPPGMRSGTAATAVGHRTQGMTLLQPEQAPAAEAFCNDTACNGATCNAATCKDATCNDTTGNAASAGNEPPPLAMQGYCPVAVLDQGEWIAGDPQNGLIHLGQLYLFSSPAAMETFRGSPEVYTPVMNGMDVVLFFEERRLVQGSREWGMTDPEFNRMFFFASEETMNHFNQAHERYTRSAIDITRQAASEANTTTR